MEAMTTHKVSDGYLELKTNDPQHVYVDIFESKDKDKPLAGFALHVDGTYYTGGLNWHIQQGDKIDDHYAMFVTLILSPKIDDIECDLWYSAKYTKGHDFTHSSPRVMMCIPYANWKAGFHFGVVPKNVGGNVHVIDPEIVITPITVQPKP